MITQENIKKILEKYDTNNLTIGTLRGHSALDVCRGAKLKTKEIRKSLNPIDTCLPRQ